MSDLNSPNTWNDFLERKFDCAGRGSTPAKEVRAAFATFFTMSYILLVNPQLLSRLGIPADGVVVSTALASAVGCILTGYFG